MKRGLQFLGVGASIALAQSVADSAVAASSKAAPVMATPAVRAARHQAQFSNPFGFGVCKYVTMKGTNFSVAVPSETPLPEIPELKNIPLT